MCRRPAVDPTGAGGLNLSMVFKRPNARAAANRVETVSVRSYFPIILAKPPEDLSNISSGMVDDNRTGARF